MREVRPSEFYSRMSVEDQIQFDRWLKANAVVASLFSAVVVAMLFLGAQSSEPADTTAALSGQLRKANLLRATGRIGEGHIAEFKKHGSVTCQTISETSLAFAVGGQRWAMIWPCVPV
jgi:hypothetical protein